MLADVSGVWSRACYHLLWSQRSSVISVAQGHGNSYEIWTHLFSSVRLTSIKGRFLVYLHDWFIERTCCRDQVGIHFDLFGTAIDEACNRLKLWSTRHTFSLDLSNLCFIFSLLAWSEQLNDTKLLWLAQGYYVGVLLARYQIQTTMDINVCGKINWMVLLGRLTMVIVILFVHFWIHYKFK